jgi:hypothetical protein
MIYASLVKGKKIDEIVIEAQQQHRKYDLDLLL